MGCLCEILKCTKHNIDPTVLGMLELLVKKMHKYICVYLVHIFGTDIRENFLLLMFSINLSPGDVRSGRLVVFFYGSRCHSS